DWHNNENGSATDSSNPCASDDHLFPQFLSASSSPILSACVTGAYDGESISAEKISDLRSPSPDVEDDLNFDTLFDQYLRSPSPPPCSTPGDASSELTRTTLAASEPDRSCDRAGPSMETFIKPAPEDVQQGEGVRDEAENCLY